MSLFQVREWWHVTVGDGEEFDAGSMVVGNLDNEPSGAVKIVTGSLHGVLRIYYPRQPEFRIDDVILEQHLDLPILQLALGAFLPLALAVLHPRKLVVYSLEGVVEAGAKASSYYNLVKAYEHQLGQGGQHFTACNMVAGPFGGVHNRDLLAVQSMDGRLQVFEQDAHAFTRRLTGALLPGPLAYLSKTDSFITCNSQNEVQSYRFQLLASSSPDDDHMVRGSSHKEADEDGAEAKSPAKGGSKKVQADWSVCLGEPALDVMVCRFSKAASLFTPDILVIGERSVFVLNEAGVLKMEKRLEHSPACGVAYSRSLNLEGACDNLLLATHQPHNPQLLVFRGQQLVWSARTNTIPVAMAVATFGGVRGLVVSLDEHGLLSLGYLGTDPPTTAVVAPPDSSLRDLDYEEVEEEHRKLLRVIKESQQAAGDLKQEPKERLLLRAQVPKVLESRGPILDDEGEGGGGAWDNWDPAVQLPLDRVPSLVRVTVRLFLSYTASSAVPLTGVTLTFQAPAFVTVPNDIQVPPIRGASSTPVIVPVVLCASPWHLATGLTVTVAALYNNDNGEPRTCQTSFTLPLAMACSLSPPQPKLLQDAPFRFTLETGRAPVPLVVLFDDMLAQPGMSEDAMRSVVGPANTNALTLRYWGSGAEPKSSSQHQQCSLVTVMVSSTGRYRVQAAWLPAVWLALSELLRRLPEYFSKQPPGAGSSSNRGDDQAKGGGATSSGSVVVEYKDAIPLDGLMEAIEHHFEARQRLFQARATLNDRAQQFRVVEKRLLVRFKEKNPAPLMGLDAVLQEAYRQVLESGKAVEAAQRALGQAADELSSVVQLVTTLMAMRFDMDADSAQVLSAHLSGAVRDLDEQGWEEVTLAGMSHLLRTVLAKGGPRENAAASSTTEQNLAMLSDTSRLKKHIAIVCDRISKGARLVVDGNGAKAAADKDGGSKEVAEDDQRSSSKAVDR